jgi:hypothetical protein
MGSDGTHRRAGTCGLTWSTGCAAVRDIRRTPHEGRNPRCLQLKASSLSCPHSPQRSLRKPSMKLAACCRTRRFFLDITLDQRHLLAKVQSVHLLRTLLKPASRGLSVAAEVQN